MMKRATTAIAYTRYSVRFHRLVGLVLLTSGLGAAHMPAVAETCIAKDSHGVITVAALRVISLNVGHGRGQGRSQLLMGGDTIRQNLGRVAQLLAQVDADVVALQEADAPSAWSGRFDHVEALAEAAGYPCREHGHHSDTVLSTFGTALIARAPLVDAATHRFKPSPPTLGKGFVHGVVRWNPGAALATPHDVHVVSVHLDYSRKSVRDAQVEEMSSVLSGAKSLIILGDLNAEWDATGSPVKMLVQRLNLHTFEPQSTDHATYRDKRLDWILMSRDLAFDSFEVLGEQVSDHLAILAKVSLNPDAGHHADQHGKGDG